MNVYGNCLGRIGRRRREKEKIPRGRGWKYAQHKEIHQHFEGGRKREEWECNAG
jgi:hypothetical protein